VLALAVSLGLLAAGSAQAAGLVAAYGFEEAAGATTADASGKGHTGTLSGASRTTGHSGNGLSFDGVNDWVNVPHAADLSLTAGGTVEAWVQPTAAGGWRTAVLKEKPGDLAYSLYANDDQNRASAFLRIGSTYPEARTSSALPLNAWTHLAMTWDGSTMRMFVNGGQAGSSTASGAITTSTGPLRFGGNGVWAEWFKGKLDDIRIYDRALSAAEIQTDLNTPVGDPGGPPSPPPPPPPGADQIGEWSSPINVPLVSVHMTLLPNGRVAMWDGFGNAPGSERVWDPATGAFVLIPSGRNLFCAVNIKLPDGRMAAIGGHINAVFDGVRNVSLFNSATNTWSAAASMNRARWYPSAVTLPDGRVLAISGDNYVDQPAQPNGPLRHPSNTVPEIYDPQANTWTLMPSAGRIIPYFPQIFVLPDGRVFDAGPDTTTRTLSLQTGQWSTVGTSPIDGHSAVMYRPGKILKSGTWADTDYPNLQVTNRAAAIDMTESSPAWREVASMKHPRSYHNMIVLPDGNVLALGGDRTSRGIDPSSGVLEPELWDPSADKWTAMAAHQRSRLYHQSSLLMPDGRVLLGGSGALNGGAPDERSFEIFSPPYLFKGARPAVTAAPDTVRHGIPFTVDTPDASRIQSVSLVGMGSQTHSVDMDQRFQNLGFTRNSGSVTVDGPANANVAPPGWYMVFVVDDRGVPSVGQIVKVPLPAGDTTAPGAPANLTATGQQGRALLNWSAATDDVGVSEYRVHRSASAGFTPSAANRVATVSSGTSYTDNGLAAGSFFYKVVAADAAGNVGLPSSEARADVLGDVTAPSVSVTAPAAGANVSGAAVAVTASASDDVGVTSVQFRLDGADLGAADTTAPYATTWDTRTSANGPHDLTAVARDAAGITTTSAVAGVTVNNDVTAPTVAVTAPAAGATVSGAAVAVNATAADNTGVTSVQFRLDGADLGAADTSAPYTVNWDSRTATNGSHNLSAVARDAAANSTTSANVAVTVNNQAPPPPPPPSGGLVASYGFEEASGTTTADSTGLGHLGTLSGATRSTAGKFGRALSFDGVNDWVTVADAGDLDLTTGMTLEAWVYPTANTAWRTVMMKEQPGNLVYALYANNTTTNRPQIWTFTTRDTSAQGTARIANNAWTHLAATYDGLMLRMFVNGVQAGSQSLTGPMFQSTGPLRFGGNSIWSEWFKGRLDDIRVYNRALSAGEIGADMGRSAG